MMIRKEFIYTPNETEKEKASTVYLMSLLAFIVGLPFPFANLIATLIFYLGNRKGTYFVRWHCWQAIALQFIIALMNSLCFYRTLWIILGTARITNDYIALLIVSLIVNILSFIMIIRAAVLVRKGQHIQWWLFGTCAQLICKQA